MAFKGDIGQISLLNIYQALNLNQQGGVLIISSGKLKRKIRFVPEGIRLLSNHRDDPEPLRQVLLKLKVLTDSQFQNVFQTKNDDELRLGDFLVHRRIIQPDLVNGPIRKHLLELIYETFFWNPAKYEFNAGTGAEELEIFQPEGSGSTLTYRVESVLMEVARREDEWKMIRKAIPSDKEILAAVDPARLVQRREYQSELKPQVIAEVKQYIDGQRTVESIAQTSTLSKYEAYRALALLKSEREIRELSTAEKKDLAERLRRRYKLKEVIDIYNYLLESAPEDMHTRQNLVSLLEKQKDTGAHLIDHYHHLADHCIARNEVSAARKNLERIVELDPHNVAAREKLFEAHLRTNNDREALAEARSLVESIKIKKDFSSGAEILEHVLKVFPKETPFYHECADFHQFDGNPEAAVNTLKAVAAIYEERKDHTRLRKTYERIASIDPSEAPVLKRIQELERKTYRSFFSTLLPSLVTSLVAACLFFIAYWVLMDIMCRIAYSSVKGDVRALVEGRRFSEAATILNSILKIYPLSSQRWQITREISEVSAEEMRWLIKLQKTAEEENLRFGSSLAQIEKFRNEKKYLEAYKRIMEVRRTGLSRPNLEKLRSIEKKIQSVFAEASSILNQAQGLIEAGKFQEAHPLYIKLLMQYPDTPTGKILEIPLAVQTMPPGAQLVLNGVSRGKSPMLLYFKPFERFHLGIHKPGFEDYQCGESQPCFDLIRDWSLAIPLKPIPNWTFDIGSPAEGGPVADQNNVYVASRAGKVFCLNGRTGELVWSHHTQDNWGIRGSLRIWRHLIYFVTADGHFMALDRTTGRLVFGLTPLTGKRLGKILVSEATDKGIVTLLDGSTITGLELHRGTTLWSTEQSRLLSAAPVIHGDNFLCCTGSGKILFLDSYRGRLTRTIQLNIPLSNPGMASRDSLYIADNRGIIYRVHLESGKVMWSHRCEFRNLSTPAVGEQVVLLGTDGGNLLALDIHKGTRRWDLQVKGGFPSPGLVLKDRFIIGSSQGLILCVSSATGKLRWTFQADGGIAATPARRSNFLFSGSEKGTVYSFLLH